LLPQTHVAYTWLAVSLAEEAGLVQPQEVDYRQVALAAMGPDLIDKPLAALHFYPKYRSAVLFAHTALVNLLVAGVAGRIYPRHRVTALAWLGHLLLDRIWHYPATLWWPFRGWRFHVWGKRGSEQEQMGWAYWYAFTRRPELWGWEAGGLLALFIFVLRHRLYRRKNILALVRTGRTSIAP
jgi:inner membrane protein